LHWFIQTSDTMKKHSIDPFLETVITVCPSPPSSPVSYQLPTKPLLAHCSTYRF
jgi:hypothetical protein